MKITRPEPIKATSLRIWTDTRNKLKAIARHYQIPMTRLLDQILTNLIEANNIPFGTEEPKDVKLDL